MGADFVSWIINIVPSSILSIFGLSKVASSYHTVTEYYRLTVGTSGGIPTDILSLGIRQFGLMGLLLISLLLSKICRFLDGIIAKVHSNNYYFITLRISSIMFLIIPYGDIDSFVRNRFDMILVFLFALVVSRKTQKVEREWSKIYAGNREKILSSDYFKSVFRLTVGSLIAQLITALVSPISTRLYTPEQLAVYTLILTVSSMFGPVLCGKYDMAIVSAKDEKEVTNLIVGGLAVSAVSITLVTMGYRFYLQKNLKY